jgi:site-specific recombinase XerD
MVESTKRQRTTQLQEWIASFLLDREAGNLSPRTIAFYNEKLNKFIAFCDAANIGDVEEITPDIVRRFLLCLKSEGHNPGGVHCHYRAVKTFVRWYVDEMEPDRFRDPFHKVSLPKPTTPLLPPVPLEDIKAMLQTCGKDWHGIRDRAAILALLDTGARAAEFTGLNVEDVNMRTGAVFIRNGKGGKSRTVFIGKTARRALRRYLRTRRTGALWIKQNGDGLEYGGLRAILRLRSKMARIEKMPYPHAFRRAFAVNMLRAGCDLETLRRLMGHSDLQVLRRYLDLLDSDLQRVHAIASPADQLRNLNKRR